MSMLSLVLRISVVIFLVEGAIMMAFSAISPDLLSAIEQSPVIFALVDTVLLTAISAPIIFFWGVRPFVIGRKQAEIAAKKAQEAQKFAERRILDIAGVTSDWFWEQDSRGRFTFMSEGIELSIGMKASDFIGKTRRDLFGRSTTESTAKNWQKLQKLIAARQPIAGFIFEMEGELGHNRKHWIKVEAAPVFSDDGKFKGYRGIGSDVTDIVGAMKKAHSANESKSAFLAMASHELRTPLNGIIGLSQILDESTLDQDQEKMVKTIRDSGEALLTTLSDLLDIAKIEAGQLSLEETAFNPVELGKKIESLWSQQCERKGISFELMVGIGAEKMRLGDPHRVRQILNNFVSNAVKFTSEGSIVVQISESRDKSLILEVADTGIGMSPEQSARIFDQYQQADETITRRFGGTGLGLSIVKRIVDTIGGEITVDSTPDHGTTFRVVLPLPVVEGSEHTEEQAVTTPSIRGVKILAAEDNEVNRLLLSTMLEPENVEMTMALDGQEAVDMWSPGKFDLLLLDISMPKKDGATALEEIRELETQNGHSETPAIALTAHAMDHQVSEWLLRGFDSVIAKPTRREELVKAIHLLTS